MAAAAARPPLPTYIPWRQGAWRRHLLNESHHSVCLDGTPGAFSFWPAVLPVRNTHWIIAFQGGGWCWTPQDCALRAASKMGSSSYWHPPVEGGILARSCHVAPEFCTYNKVLFEYCDGASFSGDANITTRSARGHASTLVSAGRAIVRAGIIALIRHYGLSKATDVLVTGSSAGGLAALLHAADIRDALVKSGAPLSRFKLLSISGLFFLPPTTRSDATRSRPFEQQLSSIFRLAKMEVSAGCLSKFESNDAWKCLAGVEPLESLAADIPVFVVQSTFDLFSTSCILGAGSSSYFELNCSSGAWAPCLRWMTPLGRRTAQRICSEEQREQLAKYQRVAAVALANSQRLNLGGSGAFIHSCHDHASYTNAWLGHRDHNTTMRAVVLRWWDAPVTRVRDADVYRVGDCGEFSQHDHTCPQKCGEWRPNFYADPRSKLIARIRALGLPFPSAK